jgi:high-affinity iron transporter
VVNPSRPAWRLAPDIVNRVEGLVWFSGDGHTGLAELIAERRPRRELRETRLALDKGGAERLRIRVT